MKTNLTRFILFLFTTIIVQFAFGQSAGDYRSKGTGIAGGPWSTISTGKPIMALLGWLP
jgi:hypothetical protein